MIRPRGRRGISPVEVIVVLLVLGLALLIVAMALPRQRERQRFAACQFHLGQLGVALLLYDQSQGRLPTVALRSDVSAREGPSPQAALLGNLGVPDLLGLAPDRPSPSPAVEHITVVARRVAGFTCPSDPNATSQLFPAPISYRATTGSTASGADGVFAPGRRISLAEVEAADGTGYTSGFAERLVGDGRPAPAPNNYAVHAGPLRDPSECRASDPGAWRGDAGSSWIAADWTNTLYNHALRPGESPSCVAADRLAAAVAASSGHAGRVNVLLLDGVVRAYTPQVDPKVWKGLASTHDLAEVDPDATAGPEAGAKAEPGAPDPPAGRPQRSPPPAR